MLMDRGWVAFFSQTGSEIANIAKEVGRWPDVIITNKRPDHLREINKEVAERTYYISNEPTLEELESCCYWVPNPIVTLHGWLRIMPPEMCNTYDIYNGHPGLITRYPELKGKDPQQRAWDLDHDVFGSVIHEVTEGVDEGKILSFDGFSRDGLDIGDYFRILSKTSLSLWVEFLKRKL